MKYLLLFLLPFLVIISGVLLCGYGIFSLATEEILPFLVIMSYNPFHITGGNKASFN